MDCIFCKIIEGSIPSYTIYEDDLVKCFLDVHPDSNGHLLIIPKKHFKDLEDIPIEYLSHIMGIAKTHQQLLKEKLHIDGLVLVQNNGSVQEVKHYHLHLKPVYKTNEPIINIEEIYKKLKES